MNYIQLKARAKINISLDAIDKREDGFHNLKMIMQTLHLHDTITIKKIYENKIILDCNLKWLPLNEKNIVYRCAVYMKEQYNIKHGLHISLQKNIPVSAGMAGGSSDCAATLIGIRNLFKLPISKKELEEIGLTFGSDVPYCLVRGTCLAEGRGEILTPLKKHPSTFVLIARPPITVSTQEIFNSLDISKIKNRPKTEVIIDSINRGDINGIANNFCNVLETITIKRHPIIQDIKNTMLENKALGSLMTGSGASVFGYFKYMKDAKIALQKIQLNNPEIKDLYVTSIYNPLK
jgi:4-diphosphocytidyl-2-C-methyl-D-erythritol kinase